MQQVVFTIEDYALEEAMADITKHEGLNLQDFIKQAIQAFIRQKSVNAKKLDPFQHSTQIHYPDTEASVDATPFDWVQNTPNSAKNYAQKPGTENIMDNVLLCDTCVIIDYINEHDVLLSRLKDHHFILFINSIIELELLYGAHDQKELKKIQQKLTLFRRLEINQDILDQATGLVTQYALSHRLTPADAIVAATAAIYDLPLFTHNTRDFRYLPAVRLWQVESFSIGQQNQEQTPQT